MVHVPVGHRALHHVLRNRQTSRYTLTYGSVLRVASFASFVQKMPMCTYDEHLLKMKQSHRKYARHIWQIMTPRDLELVKGRRRGFFLCDVGIAGIREYTKVKCLNK
ncbi:hypothetical protein PF011_g216 [Phytophthora fragariae]|uniref:Uncharacterized protein n=1 Tax=Phytophthora fragariae TaxID=53985 RepID=A0A6A3MR48_9STRA|nr:hypothetical protein PF011_g216 [Phytophthora fragariae]